MTRPAPQPVEDSRTTRLPQLAWLVKVAESVGRTEARLRVMRSASMKAPAMRTPTERRMMSGADVEWWTRAHICQCAYLDLVARTPSTVDEPMASYQRRLGHRQLFVSAWDAVVDIARQSIPGVSLTVAFERWSGHLTVQLAAHHRTRTTPGLSVMGKVLEFRGRPSPARSPAPEQGRGHGGPPCPAGWIGR